MRRELSDQAGGEGGSLFQTESDASCEGLEPPLFGGSSFSRLLQNQCSFCSVVIGLGCPSECPWELVGQSESPPLTFLIRVSGRRSLEPEFPPSGFSGGPVFILVRRH